MTGRVSLLGSLPAWGLAVWWVLAFWLRARREERAARTAAREVIAEAEQILADQ